MENGSNDDINQQDIMGVRIYRGGIVLTALCFVIATVLLLVTEGWKNPSSSEWIAHHRLLLHVSVWGVVIGTGISVVTIHLYIRQFHALLKILFSIGLAAVVFFLIMGIVTGKGLIHLLFQNHYGTFGFGFVLAALCGIAVKEAFCFGLPEAILFAVVTPILVMGHLLSLFSPLTALILLCADTFFLTLFAVRKEMMAPDLDIGDKSVYM